MQTTRTPYSVSFMATVLLLLLFACHSTIANAAVALGATRVMQPMDKQETRLQPEPSSQSLVSLLSMNNCDFDISLCAPFTKIARIIIL